MLVSTPNPDQNLTVKIWIQTQHQHYSIPLKVSVFDKNLQVIAEPLAFENCHPVSIESLSYTFDVILLDLYLYI